MQSEIQNYIQEYVDKMQANGVIPTMEQINENFAWFTPICRRQGL